MDVSRFITSSARAALIAVSTIVLTDRAVTAGIVRPTEVISPSRDRGQALLLFAYTTQDTAARVHVAAHRDEARDLDGEAGSLASEICKISPAWSCACPTLSPTATTTSVTCREFPSSCFPLASDPLHIATPFNIERVAAAGSE